MEIGIWSRCSALKLRRNIKNCSKISNKLKAIVNCPKVNRKFKLSTYGIDEMGDVPRFAFVIRLTPNELIKQSDQKYSITLEFFHDYASFPTIVL